MAIELNADPQPNVLNLVQEIARSLVDKPSNVHVEAVYDQDCTTIRVRVDPTDTGKIIGKQGKTAHSLRVILGAIGMKYQHKFLLEIVDDGARGRSAIGTPPDRDV